MKKEKENTRNCCRVGTGSLECTQGCALANEGYSISDPANLQRIHSADIVDCESVEEVSAERECSIATRKQQLNSSVIPESTVEGWPVICRRLSTPPLEVGRSQCSLTCDHSSPSCLRTKHNNSTNDHALAI